MLVKLLQYINDIDTDTAVKVIGALFGGIATLITVGVPVLYRLGFLTWAWDKITSTRKARREAFEQVFQLAKKVDRIDQELKPNGGSSFRDEMIQMGQTVERIGQSVGYLQSKFRHHDDTSDEAKFELDASGRLTYANCTFCDMINADEKDLKFFGWVSRVVNHEKEDLLKELRIAEENAMPIEIAVTFRKTPLVSQRVLLNISPRGMSTGGKVEGFFGRGTIPQDQ